MPSLVDIARQSKEVHGLHVRAASGATIADVLAHYPEIRKVMTGVEVTADQLIAIAPGAVAEIIAASCMPIDDMLDPEKKKENIAAAGVLGVGLQVDLLDAIIKMSIPSGIGPFVEKLEGISAGLDGRGAAPAMTSQKPSKS